MYNESRENIIIDFVKGVPVPNIGAEINRQKVEFFLVTKKNYKKTNIIVGAKISFELNGSFYNSFIDLVVYIGDKAFMIIKCVPGSFDSRIRETISAARLYANTIVPICFISDGTNALILNSLNGKKLGSKIEDVPSIDRGKKFLDSYQFPVLSQNQLKKEKLIFSSYDSMNVNLINKL